MMSIYVIASLKAGSGKTTLAMHLCESLMTLGSVMLLDADLTTDHFEWALQQDQRLAFEHLDVKEDDAQLLDQRLKNLQKQYMHIVVDIAGHDSKALRSVLKHADKMLIPAGLSEEDLKLAAQMQALAIAVHQYNTKMQVYLVFNKLPANTSSADIEQSKMLLQELPGAHFLNTIIYEHQDFENAMKASSCVWKHNLEQGEKMEKLLFELISGDIHLS
ncbi:ParA family protein [Acinetobacter tianfuensis]|uniref:ParA family protein n=1 Tax=Acinetobacter tianfuensis TaxID=2419603 RepID=A0A3A8EJM9_9GAMM|nr:ParA family protein [Acinetobacter tianfuensis]RKG33696.1 ParA family protein [Acinetobacter tianfuensis]